jgi:hypothetical protein
MTIKENKKIFRPSIFSRIGTTLFTLISWSAIIFLYIVYCRFNTGGVWAAPLLIFVTSVFFYRAYRYLLVRLVISDAGIEFHNDFYSVITSWENIDRIGKRVAGKGYPVEGFVLRSPSAHGPQIFLQLVQFVCQFQPYETDAARSIPLQGYWFRDWKKSILAGEIRRYAPHLFDQ